MGIKFVIVAKKIIVMISVEISHNMNFILSLKIHLICSYYHVSVWNHELVYGATDEFMAPYWNIAIAVVFIDDYISCYPEFIKGIQYCIYVTKFEKSWYTLTARHTFHHHMIL